MRKISTGTPAVHPRRLAPALGGLGLLLVVAGCGGGGSGDEQATGAGTGAPPDTACPVVVDLSGWQAFTALAGRITAGEAVSAADLAALGEQASFTVWRESMAPVVPKPERVGNFLEEAFWDELGRTSERKAHADRRDLGLSYRWSWERRARVDSLAAVVATEAWACGLLEHTRGWIAPDRLPRPVRIHAVPGQPELRWHDGHLVVDTGVLVAGGPQQLQRQLAGLLYRNLEAVDGINPLEATGDTAVAHVFRILRNEGLATWIEDLPHTYFDRDHPRLRRVMPVPEHFYQSTLRVAEICGAVLPRLFADPQEMALRGQDFARTLAAGGAFSQGGYGMAAVIAGRLGLPRLQEAAHSVPAFVAAFQEAALLNGDDRPLPGALGHEPWACVAPLPVDVYDRLLPLLERESGPR
ncbi:MAG: hypothetical protein IH621_12640 [Krumholzibacteria bacterium]|nr:hypothetical protein [Candidatus Krumholzibacteria bacterium]